MANTKKQKAQRPNVTETIYALIGWLTTRKQPLVLGVGYDYNDVSKLVGAFVDENHLPATRTNVPDLKVPAHLEHISNLYPKNAQAEPPLRPEDAIKLFSMKLRTMRPEDQDAAIAGLLQDLRHERELKAKRADQNRQEYERHALDTQTSVYNLEKVARGDYFVIRPSETLTLKTSQ